MEQRTSGPGTVALVGVLAVLLSAILQGHAGSVAVLLAGLGALAVGAVWWLIAHAVQRHRAD